MLRVGVGRPRIRFVTNRWNATTAVREAIGWGWVSVETWRRIDAYQQRPQPKESWESPVDMRRRLEHQMRISGRPEVTWELELLSADKHNWVRHYATFGEPRLVLWSWWDAHVVYPILKLVVRVLNQFAATERDQ